MAKECKGEKRWQVVGVVRCIATAWSVIVRIHAGIGGRKMFEILKVDGEYVMEEVDQGPALQVPSFVNDPERNRKRLRQLMQEEDRRAAEEQQPIVDTINGVCWSIACVLFGMIISMVR